MKKFIPLFFSFLPAIVFSAKPEKQTSEISFTENKGQICDQSGHSRPDVLFGGNSGSSAFHISRNGISYQFYRSESVASTPATGKMKNEVAMVTIFRVDQNWINVNPNSTVETDAAFDGCSNYYYVHCPDGALNVKAYKGVWLKNIYDKVDIHYYEKNGALKYDYEIAPYGDYRRIQVQIKGGNAQVQNDGSLLIKTSFGELKEESPLVFQNGKRLAAKWIVSNNMISFEISGYNASLPLTIDPVVRSWGTYYGGTSSDVGNACVTDASGNIYLAGSTGSSAGTVIATVGSHQATFGGGNYYDAFLAKFDVNGNRLWATYYGGTGGDEGLGCATDSNGNIFLTGTTTSTNGNVIATPGAHQTTHGTGGAYSSAYLVKFNSSGVRQWGTYYGGTGVEWAYGCATDASGNIYLAGNSALSSGTAVATPGSYQAASTGTTTDFFLAKFNASGVRQWGTYYGSTGTEYTGRCATDALGNVFLYGSTNSYQNMTTAGASQTTFGGGNDAVLVKFSGNGARLWATYYGGSSYDGGGGCATDANGNVFLGGQTQSPNNISTAGSFQSVLGGNGDGYLVKFNSGGVRQWGTYYGGTNGDLAGAVATDFSGNVYLAGQTSSTGGNVIATVGSQQTSFGGSSDGFLAKFDVGGVRQWGTYYGGTGNDYFNGCSVDIVGNIYAAGTSTTTSGTLIASLGSFQSSFGGYEDACLARFTDCAGPPSQPGLLSGNPNICAASINTYSAAAAAGAVSYSWSLPAGFTGSSFSSTISTISGTVSGIFSLTALNACGASAPVTLSVTVNPNPTPTITVNSGSICSGKNFTIAPSGAASYTYSPSGPVVSPVLTSTYSVIGTSSAGCVSSFAVISTVVVNPNPTISVSSGTMCIGNSFNLAPFGAVSFTYSGGSPIVTPTANASYTVTGSSASGCTNTAVSNITVIPLPTISVMSSDSIICGPPYPGTATLTASGGASYLWDGVPGAASMAVSPSVTSVFTVTGSDVNGCSNTATINLVVSPCLGVSELSGENFPVVFPNPVSDLFFIRGAKQGELNSVELYNSTGQLVFRNDNFENVSTQFDISKYPDGIYLAIIQLGETKLVTKLIKN